jgi:hypothetical protein
MAHLTLREVIDLINRKHSYYSSRELRGASNGVQTRLHHPEYYVPRITRLFAGLLFGKLRAGEKTTLQAANGPYSIHQSWFP